MKVLYISYDGALDPLGHSQIVPYIKGLSRKGIEFTLLTFEKKEWLQNKDVLVGLRKLFCKERIRWVYLPYYKSPNLLATLINVLQATVKGWTIILKDKIEIIHVRSFVGAIPALCLVKLLRLKFIFDMRGFWPEERIEGNIWKRKDLIYKITKWCEKKFLSNADWIVCLTEEAKRIILEFDYLKNKKKFIDVIPTCVDLERFKIQDKDDDFLKRFDLQDRFIFIYFGSLGTWYILDEMIVFFKIAHQMRPDCLFLVLTPNREEVAAAIHSKGINHKNFFINFVNYADMPKWISKAAASLFFIKPAYSKKSSCPTKFAESLACGLPVITNSGIGDIEEIMREQKIGVVVENFDKSSYRKAFKQLLGLLKERKMLSERCRSVAVKYFSLEDGVDKYLKIYQDIFASRGRS